MSEPVDIKNVPKDVDDNLAVRVYNPLGEQFECNFGGKPFTLKPGANVLPEPIARHLAKHLALKICREQTNEFLQSAFPGLDEIGREKWRINTSHTISPGEWFKIRDLLLSGLDQEPKITKVPETEAKAKLRGVREAKKVRGAKEKEQAEEEEAKEKEEK